MGGLFRDQNGKEIELSIFKQGYEKYFWSIRPARECMSENPDPLSEEETNSLVEKYVKARGF